MNKLHGDSMEILVNQNRLQRADILVTRTKGSLLGWSIRRLTNSYWNHAVLVFVIRDPEEGNDKNCYQQTFIIESGGSGIDIHNITKYLKNPKKYDVGILRWEPDWLDDQNRLKCCRYIRGFALEEIDDKYNHWMIFRIFWRIITPILGLSSTLIPKRYMRIGIIQRSKRLERNFNSYICSGFVQWSYYQGLIRTLDEIKVGDTNYKTSIGKDTRINDYLDSVVFNPRVNGQYTNDELLSTTPADLANCPKLNWKYVVINGEVCEVSDNNEVDMIIK